MNLSSAPLEEAVAELRGLVAKDGGDLTLLNFDPDARSVAVAYRMAEGDDCASCAITPDIMEAFLAEAFRVRGASVSTITLESPQATNSESGLGEQL